MMDLNTCVPEDKHDTAAIERAVTVGYPELNPVLPNLLEWLQDANWPVAIGTAELLAKAGPDIVPHIKTILNSDDGIWKYWVLTLVLENMRLDTRDLLREDLVRLATTPTLEDQAEEVDIAAQKMLAR